MTTSAARCRLYEFIDKVDKGGGEVLYMDTDSIIYKYQGPRPIEPGKNLGDMVDEYPNHRILEVVAGGCKNYSLRIKKKGDVNAEDEYVIKVRIICFISYR